MVPGLEINPDVFCGVLKFYYIQLYNLYKNFDTGFKNIIYVKMDVSVVATTFFSLTMLMKRRPACFMNKIKKNRYSECEHSLSQKNL